MSANKKVVLIVFLGAAACLLGFFVGQYFSKRTHEDQILLVRIQSMGPRIEHIRMLSESFVQDADAVHWQAMVRDMASLEADLLSGTRANRQWAGEFQELKTGVDDYRKLLDRVHDPALRLKAVKTRLEGLGLSFSEEVRKRIIEPYRKEEGLGLYQGRRVDPIKTRIKETAYDVMLLHLQQRLILMELIADWDLPGYRRKKETIARTMEKHKVQLRYLSVLMGDDAGIGPVIASLGGQMDDLMGHETTIVETFEDLTRLNAALTAGGAHLLKAGEILTDDIVADIAAANRLYRFLSWGGLIAILGALGALGAMLAKDIIRFVQDTENSRDALRESEELLGLALDSADEGIWDWHLANGRAVFDSRYYKIAGYEPDEFPATYEEWKKRVHPDDIQSVKEAIKNYLTGASNVADTEFRYLRKDGTYMWIQGRGKIVARNEQGEAIRLVGTHADITKRKQMEESLRITQFSFDNAPLGIYLTDADRRVLEVNAAAARTLGYSREELSALAVWDIETSYAKRDNLRSWEDDDAGWEIAKKRSGVPFEAVHRKKDGCEIPVEVNSNLFEYGGRRYAIAFVQDITERKQNEEELSRLRNYLSNIIDSMPSVLVAVDREGNVTQWNHRTEQITGLDLETVRSQPLGRVFPRLAGEMDRIQQAIRERRVISTPKVCSKPEPEPRFEDITIFPLAANGVEGAVIRVDDVTEKVRLEEMMIQSEKMLSVGGLAAGMAHEINNPLAGMMQTAEVMAQRLGAGFDLPANRKAAEAAGATPDAIARFMEARGIPRMLATINDSGRRVAAIVDNMLSFARKSDASVSSHGLGDLLDKTAELASTDYDLKKQFDFKRIEIRREYADPPVSVVCEIGKIQQVLLNILRNGAEAMQEAGTEAPRFIFRTRVDHGTDMGIMEIEDNGPGMDEQTRKRIFEPFFTTKPVGVGTGLGLSVSYFIVTENHRGEMAVESSPGVGTKFTIRLPVKGGRVE